MSNNAVDSQLQTIANLVNVLEGIAAETSAARRLSRIKEEMGTAQACMETATDNAIAAINAVRENYPNLPLPQ